MKRRREEEKGKVNILWFMWGCGDRIVVGHGW
jgi:hypothetical protein